MPEGMNVEVAHKLRAGTPGPHRGRWHELVEVVEVAILAIVGWPGWTVELLGCGASGSARRVRLASVRVSAGLAPRSLASPSSRWQHRPTRWWNAWRLSSSRAML